MTKDLEKALIAWRKAERLRQKWWTTHDEMLARAIDKAFPPEEHTE